MLSDCKREKILKLYIPRIAEKAGKKVLLERPPCWREMASMKKNNSASDLIYCVRRVFLEEQTCECTFTNSTSRRSIDRITTCL